MSQPSFAQHFCPACIDRLATSCELVSRSNFTCVSDIAATGRDVDVLVTGWGSPWLGPDVLTQLPRLGLVAHAAGSLKPIIDPALLDRGVSVTSAAAANAMPVAEFTLSWILRWNKRLDDQEQAYRTQRDSFDFRGLRLGDIGNFGATVGIVSASHVGRALLRLMEPFEIECLLYDPFVSAEAARGMGATKVGLDELMAASDVVSLNAPLLPETENMIGARELAAMKDGALFINTARGRIVDHDCLVKALGGGRITAVLDVTEPEPLPVEHPLWSMPNVHLTPHVAGSLGREIRRMTEWCVAEVERFARGERLIAAIGPQDWGRAA
ncbi:hydroxyacid dehydrogenase [Pseudoruegeria sp. HB172150]|uniref:hydroxyacid dehydrogenase n=1 Tax=Pseudoruegeria sp. HB172150 TaxID=2721164 RepID=UPI001556729D|nr:hydroxyacid dehydrogenase [Pseudoruegeria sp. HB172150]